MTTSKEVHFKSRPTGMPTPDNFEVVTVDVPAPGAGEVQVKNLYMSVDPYMRGRLAGSQAYAQPWELGAVMKGGAVGTVVVSNDPSLNTGDLVLGDFAWREIYNAPASALMKVDAQGIPPQAFLGIAGMPGRTAYVGLLHIASLKDGDVVFVSAASGAVGSAVVQIAKLKGNYVIGSAGGAEKCAYLKEIGCDAVIDYKAVPSLNKALREAAPNGIDVYFDNVGGEHLDAAMLVANRHARFAECGMISQYNEAGAGIKNPTLIVGKALRIQGFIVSDHPNMMAPFLKDMTGWIKEGKITWRETVDDGIDNAVGAFLKLFTGDNLGKMLVKLG